MALFVVHCVVCSVVAILNEQVVQEQFHIYFRRSGGFTGISTSVEIDSRELASGEAEELKLLIVHSGFFEAVTSANNFVNMPDQFQYNITIEHTGKRRTLEFSDGSAPDLFRPLINYLVRVARARRKNS